MSFLPDWSDLIETLDDSVAIIDSESRILAVNRAWRAFGDANGLEGPDHCVGARYLDTMDETHGFRRQLQKLLAGEVRRVRYRYTCNSPSELRWFRVEGSRIGTLDHFILRHTDASNVARARRRSESFAQRARQAEANFRGLLEAVPGPALAVGPDLSVRFANRHFRQVSGQDSIKAILHSASGEELRRALIEAFAGRSVHFQLTLAGATPIELDAWTSPASWNGAPCVLVLGIDVTERNRLRKELIRSEKLAAVGAIVAGVAHEINNPLTYVALNLEHLKQLYGTSSGTPFDEIVRDVHFGVERVQRIVLELKRSARVEPLHVGPVEVRAIVQNAVALALPQIRYQTQFRSRMDEEIAGCRVLADEGRIVQILLNLLINAAQAIRGRPESNLVELVCSREDGRVSFSVLDSGTGIPEEVRPHIFAPFFTTKPDGVGTGLGLSICQSIAAEHGSEIRVTSTPGQGSNFSFSLDLAGETLPMRPVSSIPPAPAEVSHGRRRVLIVDDDERVRRALRRVLSETYDVLESSSATGAREMLAQRGEISAIVCDLMMHEGDGRDFYEFLTIERPDALSRVVFITGGAVTPEMSAFVSTHRDLVLDKPIDARQLLKTLAQLTSR
ncbi:MAG: response regulator [Deltaproteobacteria bacterium]|nr:response regulator [Deltaproteobacteria bacterium]